MAGVRSFVAVHVAEAALRELDRAVRSLKRAVEGAGLSVSWVPMARQHVTLKFLGDIEEKEIAGLAGAWRAAIASAQLPEVELALVGLGAFPTLERPRVLYGGVADARGGPPASLLVLQQLIEQVAEARGHPREDRPFRPHLTIARVRALRGPAPLAQIVAPFVGRPFGPPSKVDEIVLYESRLSPGGPHYIARERIVLSERSGSHTDPEGEQTK
ncbi:MAG: RNA 2',3'-cyclic phosphodiesterase [Myxococcales bacterium]|nr:RNA 2',3'-cyclic phosphodiesterase [Myxococcota bacterium]MDW8281322.1 RNA 2',3'-cyclic phosphodiesterase [Myxococcales bacterium]